MATVAPDAAFPSYVRDPVFKGEGACRTDQGAAAAVHAAIRENGGIRSVHPAEPVQEGEQQVRLHPSSRTLVC